MKTTYDKLATGSLIFAFLFSFLATLDTSSSASSDPWILPVIVAAILSLNWYNKA